MMERLLPQAEAARGSLRSEDDFGCTPRHASIVLDLTLSMEGRSDRSEPIYLP
jgi:hypothetical protein